MVDLTGQEEVRNEVSKYFPFCPFCSQKTVEGYRDYYMGGDSAECHSCGARWHLHLSTWTDKLQWAELIKLGREGGEDLLGVRHKPDFWKQMSIRNAESRKEKAESVKEEKLVVREIHREVIVKVRCPYCRRLYDETLDVCPNCGGKR